MTRKAVVAMSGGVDSSAAAYLLQQSGFTCIGITLKLFSNADLGRSRGKTCCSLGDVRDAQSVAYRLSMPHYVLNFAEDFKNQVIHKFIETYQNGNTPNPCIDCNRKLKFEGLLRRAEQLDFEYIATGHYARIERSGDRFLLKKARDAKKDQSYVLYTMTQRQLARTLFPLGDMTKAEVRDLAETRGFVNAQKQDSQDLCFVPDGDYAGFIERYTGSTAPPGPIVDETGTILGMHRGLIRYTIGQRRGLGLSASKPRYVQRKSAADNTLIVSGEDRLYAKGLIAENINLIAADSLEKPLRGKAKTRYLQTEQPAIAEQISPDRLRIDFDEPQRAVTPGQAAVLYDGETVVGGGTITSVLF
ncbi:MAG: tRNA 2-thiouridine(34) synthase MnmA [Spirochaetaceae bacterium]|jgi:tRNA-specific 2-thiouridylase|nr:tRNA 2-thiouridine(34) synthase MnmA [Spirochaetaceae bacterium]